MLGRHTGGSSDSEPPMDLGEHELRLQVAHRRTETTVRPGTEGDESKVRPCCHDALVVEPRGVIAVGVWAPPAWVAMQRIHRYPDDVSATYAVPADAVVGHRKARREGLVLYPLPLVEARLRPSQSIQVIEVWRCAVKRVDFVVQPLLRFGIMR